ncbi:MAG: Hsp20 family protein, partial [Firmicutes bacterium]|nr:Hsp20 family protein [Bacillota bacterium]
EKLFSSLDSCVCSKNVMNTDVIEKENIIELIIDLPGFRKEDLKIELENGNLRISAERNIENEEKDADGKCVRKERNSESRSRVFHIGKHVRREDINAKFENGTLKLSFPRLTDEQVENKKYIDIK